MFAGSVCLVLLNKHLISLAITAEKNTLKRCILFNKQTLFQCISHAVRKLDSPMLGVLGIKTLNKIVLSTIIL